MLADGTSILTESQRTGRAVAAITTYTLESTRSIVSAAEAAGQPVILQAGSSSFGAVGREALAASCLAAARAASVPVGVHLDHSTDREEISACLALGYTSVMVDGSHLPFEQNVALTRAVVEEAHALGTWVEGELGALAGDEDSSSGATAGETTDPGLAAQFVERTGVDALAVAVGNVHGFTEVPVHLDLDLLQRIAAVVSVPLVLHGASGLPDREVAAAVALGVAKVNINAELRRAHVEALTEALLTPVGDDIRALQRRTVAAMSAVALDKISLLTGSANDRREVVL
jgi:ketose-bisphosphate aldolase